MLWNYKGTNRNWRGISCETETAHCCTFAKKNNICTHKKKKKKTLMIEYIFFFLLIHTPIQGRLQSLETVKMFAAKQLCGWFHRYTGSLVRIRIRHEDWDDDWKSSKSPSDDGERPLWSIKVITTVCDRRNNLVNRLKAYCSQMTASCFYLAICSVSVRVNIYVRSGGHLACSPLWQEKHCVVHLPLI